MKAAKQKRAMEIEEEKMKQQAKQAKMEAKFAYKYGMQPPSFPSSFSMQSPPPYMHEWDDHDFDDDHHFYMPPQGPAGSTPTAQPPQPAAPTPPMSPTEFYAEMQKRQTGFLKSEMDIERELAQQKQKVWELE